MVSGAEKLLVSMLARWAWTDSARLWLTWKTLTLWDGRRTKRPTDCLKVAPSMRCITVISVWAIRLISNIVENFSLWQRKGWRLCKEVLLGWIIWSVWAFLMCIFCLRLTTLRSMKRNWMFRNITGDTIRWTITCRKVLIPQILINLKCAFVSSNKWCKHCTKQDWR